MVPALLIIVAPEPDNYLAHSAWEMYIEYINNIIGIFWWTKELNKNGTKWIEIFVMHKGRKIR